MKYYGTQKKPGNAGPFLCEVNCSVHRDLEAFARLEGRVFCSFDLDGSPGLWVAAGASSAFTHLECAEAYEGHRLTGLQAGGNGLDESVQCSACGSGGNVSFLGDGLSEFCFVHGYPSMACVSGSNVLCGVSVYNRVVLFFPLFHSLE